MRIFINMLEMVREAERDLFEMGIRVHPATMQDKQVKNDAGFETKELQAYGFQVTNVEDLADIDAMLDYMKVPKEYVEAEFQDRVNPEYQNPGNAYKTRLDVWTPFLRDGQFAYTYNERWRDQLPRVIRELQVRPETRQAILTMYDRHEDMANWGGKDRVPCSLHWQFLIREGALHVIYVMRSCDLLTHFPIDIALSARLLRHVASVLGINCGTLTYFTGSLHAYQKDLAARGIF